MRADCCGHSCGFSGPRSLGYIGGVSWFVLRSLALNRRIDTDHDIAELVEELVEPEHFLARRLGLPCPHYIFALNEIRQPVLTPIHTLVEERRQSVGARRNSVGTRVIGATRPAHLHADLEHVLTCQSHRLVPPKKPTHPARPGDHPLSEICWSTRQTHIRTLKSSRTLVPA